MILGVDVMSNNKGQALVEFIIVAPILILIIMAIVDISNIASKKMKLENNLDTVVSLYQDKNFNSIESLSNTEHFIFNYEKNNDTTTISLKQNIKVFTPFLNKIIGNNYSIETKRIIYEQ